jgi:hypothetical protein
VRLLALEVEFDEVDEHALQSGAQFGRRLEAGDVGFGPSCM